MKYEATGKVLVVGETKSYGNNGYEKREVVVDVAPPQARWNNPLPFTLSKEKCAWADGIAVDDEVRVVFAINGRAWDGPNGTRYFTDLTVLELEKVGSTSVGVTVSADAYPHTARGAWAAWCKTRDAKDAAGFAAFIGETCPVVASTAKAKGMKFSQVANEEDWARIIDALTGAGADETPADDPSDLPF